MSDLAIYPEMVGQKCRILHQSHSENPTAIYDPARTRLPFTLGTLQGSRSMGTVKMEVSEIVEEHLFLAELIAFDYANIPGCRLDEARSEATMGLIRAANAYNPEKGEFIPFASKAIRNALNTLYARQLRMQKIFPKSLEEPISRSRPSTTQTCSDAHNLLSTTKGAHDIQKEIRQNEAAAALESVMNLLTPRERMAVEALRIGKSYPEIGETLGITKQAAHKSARSALQKLRAGLERLGYQGIASDGLLASRRKKKDSGLG